jgi:hypothetical protein
MNNDNPTGETMLTRANRVRDKVKAQLPNYPPGRGNHPLNYLYYLKHYCYKQVRVQTKPTIVLKYASFEAFLHCPSFETVRRRTQEIQHEERARIWKQVEANLGRELDQEGREGEEPRKEFDRLAKQSDLLPTKRTREKRNRNEKVHVEYFSDKQMRMGDF